MDQIQPPIIEEEVSLPPTTTDRSFLPSKVPFYKNFRIFVPLAVVTLLFVIAATTVLVHNARSNSGLSRNAGPTPTINPELLIARDQASSEGRLSLINKTLSTTSKLTQAKGGTSSKTSTPTPTSTRSRTPNPPLINISYPSENQSIALTSGQTLCVVDSPNGGDESGLQRRQNVNGADWTAYASVTTLCFDPREGSNSFELQYKNDHNESSSYTRNFTFHRILDITVTFNGHMYRDENCNALKDSNEGSVTTSTTVNVIKQPEQYILGTVSSDSSGNFSYSKTIAGNSSIAMEAIPVAPSGYKSNTHYTYPTVTFDTNARSTSQEYPMIPNEFYSSCISPGN